MPQEAPQTTNAVPATGPEEKPSRALQFWFFVKRHGVIAVGTVIVMIFTPFLIVSESTVKKYVDGWLNDCLLVFEVSELTASRLLVRGYAQGKLPSTVPVTFAAKAAEINSIQFINHVDKEGADPYVSLAVHPQANRVCPGQLCESQGVLTSSVYITVALSDVHPSLIYSFQVDFNGKVKADNLRLFVQYDAGLKEGVCRVEQANIFNLFVRLTKWGQFIVAVLAFVCITILIAAARLLIKGDQQ